MKKVLCISLIAALCFTACNNSNTATKDDKATEQQLRIAMTQICKQAK